MRLAWFSLVLLLAALTASHAQSRQTVDLGGEWEFVKVKDLATGPPAAGWAKMNVPGALLGYDYERAWFRRDFVVPETMRGQRIVLRFGGVKWNSTVRVNGQVVGGHYGGYEPFTADLTAVAKVGQSNRLELGCHDWTGVFLDHNTDFSILKERAIEIRAVPRDEILSPVGGLVSQYGPWDRITLESHPAVYVKDLFLKPSVRQHRLTVEYTLANETAQAATVALEALVDDRGQTPLSLKPRTLSIPANGEATATLEAAWPNPRLWSPEDPHLYFLVSKLTQEGRTADELRTRFGFREFWVEGSHFILNGQRINLLATSWWPELFVTRDYIRDRLKAIKAANCVIFRTHTQPWPEQWYEVADEVGLMMIPEGPVWNDRDAYRINDPKFWENYGTTLKAMVDRDKNKPAVVMYSLENEFYGGRLAQGSAPAKELAHLGQLMKQWDPTRPIYYESDGDPGGVADAIGLHYPHEYPSFTDWPNTAYWMDQPLLNKFFAPTDEQAKRWVWDRNKPVYIGEFLWVPASDPSWNTVFYGDDAYLDYRRYHIQSKADSWRMAIQAYRQYEVGGISPWTMVEGGQLDDTNPMYVAQREAMQPVAAYVREYDHNFYSGDQVTRTADVYNDTLRAAKLTVKWGLAEGDHVTAQGDTALDLSPGERREVKLAVQLPTVTARREVALRLTVERDGKVVFTATKPWSVFPPLKLQGTAVGLYDPAGKLRAQLQQAGLATTPVTDLAGIPETVKTLIVANGALQSGAKPTPIIGAPTAGTRRLLNYTRAGGRVLVLEQTAYPTGAMPVGLTPRTSTLTFAQQPGHPLLRNVQPGDLKWWRPDNYVSLNEPPRPAQAGFHAVVVSGSAAGLANAPLLELTVGNGSLVLCQLRVGERLGVEPVAGLLLQNALDYLGSFGPALATTALYCPEVRTREVLDGLGLQATDITAHPAQADWANLRLLLACHPVAGLAPCLPQMQALLARGGTVLLHGLTPEELGGLKGLLPEAVKLGAYRGPVTKIPGADGLSACFANEDLYWLGPQQGPISWATRARAGDMATTVVLRSLAGKPTTAYDHAVMTVAGTFSANRENGASLATGGSTATVQIEVPRDGPYLLGVVAGGSQALGEWPAGAVLVDGKPLGDFACQKGELDTYALPADLKAGKHEVVIRFTNDAWDEANKQDRNLLVGGLLVAADDRSDQVRFLTSPPAVAVVAVGTGRVVLDGIKWDTTERETEKANRYIAGLLTALGAPCAPPGTGTILDLAAFSNDPNMHWFRREGEGVYLGDTGFVQGTIECARAGRYAMKLTARGTPAEGTYPIIAVDLDGQAVGQVELKSDGWRGYTLPVDLAAGRHDLKLSFTNDLFSGGQDRNLWIARVEFSAGNQ